MILLAQILVFPNNLAGRLTVHNVFAPIWLGTFSFFISCLFISFGQIRLGYNRYWVAPHGKAPQGLTVKVPLCV